MKKNSATHIFVGIDPSIHSTGMCVWIQETNFYHLYNIRSKRTKKEENLMPKENALDVVMYEYKDPNVYKKEDVHKFELAKTLNVINIKKEIKKILISRIMSTPGDIEIHCCIETPAFKSGSHTTSLIDLCGLNYSIREMILGFESEFAYKVSVTLIPSTPTEIKKYATGRGDADKELMLFCFSLLMPEICETYSFMKLDDIADAHFMMSFSYSLYYEGEGIQTYSDEEQELINKKINETKILKREKKLTIKNNKVWDDSMTTFADNL